MTKIIKRISAVAIAAVTTAMITVTASAEHKVLKGNIDNIETKGIIVAYESEFEGLRANTPLWAATYFGSDCGKIHVGLDVVDYYTGELLSRDKLTEEKYYGAIATSTLCCPHLTLFSAHEVTYNNKSWGKYQQLIDV